MHYPWWYVPVLTSPMLIAIIAVLHVLVSHYAVGGGLFFAVETSFAYQTGNREYLAYLRRHAPFFILLTVVFGAITGVGIWWTIGLASPLATEVLIRTFVFGWATEWVFFVIELTAAFIFYYYWDRLPPRIHQTIAWIYALAAWISLVLITGITAFMLYPGRWLESPSFWTGFFNPQFVPQVIARTGGAILLSSLYVYLHSSLALPACEVRSLIIRRSTRPAFLGAALITLGGIGWLLFLPHSARLALEAAAVLTVLTVLIFALTIVVFGLLYVGPYRNPEWMTPGFAASLFIFGLAAFSTGEFIREAVRKPYVVYGVVLGNQVLEKEVTEFRRNGFLQSGLWTRPYVADRWPQTLDQGKIVPDRLLALPEADRKHLGQVIFMHHCNDCHAAESGYSAVGPILFSRPKPMLVDMIRHLHETHYFMPPWSGTAEEAEVLADYLLTIAPERPTGIYPSLERLESQP
ncbi:MAG: cytochrome ubiquinol oxidase subunit I [Thermogutta sp.]